MPDDREERTGALSDEFEEAAPSNQYLTKKDLRYIAIGLVIVLVACYPLYIKLKKDKERYICNQNLIAVSHAMATYQADNDGRFPPTFVHADSSPYPQFDEAGRPVTWASTLSGLAGFDLEKHSFVCPSAARSEYTIAEGPRGADLPMTYGMYEAFDAASPEGVASPSRSVLVTETSSNGALGTYDPKPMSPVAGRVQDGFLIGWSTGDFEFPADNKFPMPSVTRVAVYDSKAGLTNALYSGGQQPQSRHDDRIEVLFADGHTGLVSVGLLLRPEAWSIPVR